jgi:hypothetical protein
MKLSRATFALLLSIVLASPALAADEPPVVQALFKTWQTQYKIEPTYQKLSIEGDTITIEGLEASPLYPKSTGSEGGGKLAVGKIALKAVSDRGNGIFEVEKATYSDLKLNVGNGSDTLSITIPSTTSEGWYVKSPSDNPTPNDIFRNSLNIAHKTTSGPITITASGKSVTADGYEMTWDGDVDTGAGKSTFKISNIAVPENVIATVDPAGTLKQIGYTNIAFDLGGEGKFDVADGKLGFDFNLSYAGKDMGTVKLGAAAGEIPMALLSELRKDEVADFNKIMPMVQAIQLSRLLFRFEDQSITKRILPLAAKMQGIDQQTLIANAAAIVQLSLMPLKNQAFTQEAMTAIVGYLKDPHSITLSAKPAAPVTIMQVMSVDPNNPGAAIDRLGVSIRAND